MADERKLRDANPWAVLLVVSLGFFMTLLDLTIVNIAIPNMITKLHASLDDILWVINAYALVLAVLVITAGRLGDLIGPRIMFIGRHRGVHGGLGRVRAGPEPRLADRVPRRPGAGRGHAHAADADDHHQHVPAGTARRRVRRLGRGGRGGHHRRADPGRAAGHRVRLAVDLLRQPADRRARAGADARSSSRTCGRAAGTGSTSPACCWPAPALLAICYGLVEGQKYNWGTITWFISIPLVLGVGVLLLVAFLLVQRLTQDKEPLVPFALFRDRNYAVVNWVSGVLAIGMMGIFLPFTIYLQSVLGFSALKAGLAMAPASLISMFVAPVAGRLTDKIGGKYILMSGLTLFGGGHGLARADRAPALRLARLPGPADRGRPRHGLHVRADGHDGHARTSSRGWRARPPAC